MRKIILIVIMFNVIFLQATMLSEILGTPNNGEKLKSNNYSIDKKYNALLTFNAQPMVDRVYFTWVTNREKSNTNFIVERSKDRLVYRPVTTVVGVGSSGTASHYAAYDQNPIAGWVYYRLKQEDYNGDFSYSEIIPVHYSPSKRDDKRYRGEGI